MLIQLVTYTFARAPHNPTELRETLRDVTGLMLSFYNMDIWLSYKF